MNQILLKILRTSAEILILPTSAGKQNMPAGVEKLILYIRVKILILPTSATKFNLFTSVEELIVKFV